MHASQEQMIKKGPWSAEEDEILLEFVKKNGPREWSSIRSNNLLPRTGKSCRLRWVNKLRPNLKMYVSYFFIYAWTFFFFGNSLVFRHYDKFIVANIRFCRYLGNEKQWVQIFSRGRESGVRFTSRVW